MLKAFAGPRLRDALLRAAGLALAANLLLPRGSLADETVAPPVGVSPNGRDIHGLYVDISYPAIVVFLLVEICLLIIIFKYRRRRPDDIPPQIHGHSGLEVTWTVLPLIVILGIGALSFAVLQQDFQKLPDSQTQMNVEVDGHQFYWQYTYLDSAEQLPDGKQLSIRDTLTVPTGTTIRLKVDGMDVIHSWWVPEITGKTDAVPGYDNFTWFRIDQTGSWSGQCAELCGAGHSTMLTKVVAVSQPDFQSWLASQLNHSSSAGGAA